MIQSEGVLLISSIHHHKPLILTSSGQRHYQEKIGHDSEDESEKQSNKKGACFIENSIKLWWVGNEKTLDESDKIIEDNVCKD